MFDVGFWTNMGKFYSNMVLATCIVLAILRADRTDKSFCGYNIEPKLEPGLNSPNPNIPLRCIPVYEYSDDNDGAI